jgi:glyoxylase-like metal-dependent hydrolase (beta-lactamase superfamily II)
MANDIEVIHSPGHCAGHIALLLRQEGILIAGDICSNIMGLSKSILRVAAYPFERAVWAWEAVGQAG